MRKYSGWLTKILPFPSDDIRNTGEVDRRYKSFTRGLCLILMVLVLVPLTIISTLSHSQYKQLLEQEELDQLILNLEESQSAVGAFVSELTSVVKFIASGDCRKNVLDSENLKGLLARLQIEYPGFVDIQVIDSNGMQKAYAGPYQLRKYNYSDQLWYKEVHERGVAISNVFTGFRNVPHFVIAVSRNVPSQKKPCVLRVTINASTLQEYIDTIDSGYADDLFLVDSNRVAQTTPQKYGELGGKCALHDKKDPTDSHSIKASFKNDIQLVDLPGMVVFKRSFAGEEVNHAVADLLDTPWSLVLVKEQYLHADSWVLFQIRLVTIFLSCAIVAVFVIVEISYALTAHIRESDKKRQQLYSEAENSNKLASIGRLAAGVAHEINNPLSIINQKTGLMQDFMEFSDDFTHKDVMSESLDGIQKSVERCKVITHRLLGFARQTDVAVEEIDVNATIREVIDFLAKEATYNQIVIGFDLSQDIQKIWSDRGPLQQVFLNIANNAIDAIGSNGKIILRSRTVDEKTIQVNIIDDGPGMPPDVLQHIFEPFFTTKETGKGTGLGLSITYGLVEKLGGDITVDSEIGKGTTFNITLPVQQSN
jgi:two-component system, NtrC family, sensor kinase